MMQSSCSQASGPASLAVWGKDIFLLTSRLCEVLRLLLTNRHRLDDVKQQKCTLSQSQGQKPGLQGSAGLASSGGCREEMSLVLSLAAAVASLPRVPWAGAPPPQSLPPSSHCLPLCVSLCPPLVLQGLQSLDLGLRFLTNYICKDLASKPGPILRFLVDVDLRGTLFMPDSR